MTKVDELVREMMLTYPTLYPNRSTALHSIFTDTGTNYVWNRKGCIVWSHKPIKDFDGLIDISDLAKSDEQWDRDDEFARTIRIENELERRNRLYRAENIDLICQFGGRGEYGYRHLDWYTLDKMEGDYGVANLFRAPFGKVDADWASALEGFIADMLVTFNRVYRLHFDKPLRDEKAPEPTMYSQMPEAMQRRHDNLIAVSDKIDAQTGRRAKAKAFMESVTGKNMMKEIADSSD